MKLNPFLTNHKDLHQQFATLGGVIIKLVN